MTLKEAEEIEVVIVVGGARGSNLEFVSAAQGPRYGSFRSVGDFF